MAPEKTSPQEPPLIDGKVRLEPHVLKRLLIGRGWTLKDFCSETGMQMRTVHKVVGGERIQMSTARSVAKEFGVTLLDIVDTEEYRSPTFSAEPQAELGTGEWLPGRALTPVITTANKLQYRVYCMTHAFEPLRRGRGKRYEFEQLDDEAREAIRHRFTRHLSVCARLDSHPQFPACYTTFPDAERHTWWVIDQWIDGDTLAEQLRCGHLEPKLLSRVGQQLATGIAVAHEVGIILRELTPDGVILAEPDMHVVMTDFELAKLTDDYPTVSEDEWTENDYRAPEIGAEIGNSLKYDKSKELEKRLIEFVSDGEQQLRDGERLPMSTEILESSFGLYKQLERQHSKSGFTSLLACFPALLKPTTPELVIDAFRRVSRKEVKAWVDQYFSSTVSSRRRSVYDEHKKATKGATAPAIAT